MHKKLPSSRYRAIRQLVSSYLIESLSVFTEYQKIRPIREENIPLHKGRDFDRILYISGVALQISKYENVSAMEIASDIGSHFSATCSNDFHVQIVSPGWIHLELTHPLLAAWLQDIAFGYPGVVGELWSTGAGEEISPHTPHTPHTLFTAQYAHARCYSLLRLAHQEGLIKLWQEGQQENYNESLHSSNPYSPSIPWLDGDRIRLTHPASGRLIAELVRVVDQFECHGSVKWETAALTLSQAFESFWSHCRIFGEVKTTSPELAQARLGLVMATQSVLRFLLEEKLGISAVMEL